ncbi:phosphohistidine phosphatase SixA [Escherichia coli]
MPATVFFLWFQMKENGRIWLTKAVQYASFYHASRRRSLDAASDSVRPLTTNGCDESRLMANWLKGQKVEIERVLVSPFLRAEQTLEEVGDCLNLPSSAEVLPELTPCGDVGLVSAYLQALTNEGVASVLVISHLPLVGYLVAELCPGETPPMFTTSAIASVTLDESGNGTFNWQMSPCNLKMAKAI